MSKGIIDLLLQSIFDANWKGRYGEKLTERELKLVRLLGRKGYVLRNVYVPKDNGETSEIDVLFITQKGIFVIESKNYSGWIFGDEKAAYWTATLPNGSKNRFFNPIKQNNTHIKWLRQYLGDDIPLYSIVAFSERCELKNVMVQSFDKYVIKRKQIYATVRRIWEYNEDKLDESRVEEIYKMLEALTHVDEAVKKAHVENINDKYHKKEKPVNGKQMEQQPSLEQQEQPDRPKQPETSTVCPRCGKELLLRTAKKGSNAGKSFYGCSGFPKCRYVQNLEEAEKVNQQEAWIEELQ